MATDPHTLHSLNLALRAGLVAVLLLVALVLWRDHRRSVAARLGTACALGVAAYALYLLPGFAEPPQVWQLPIAALSTGNAVVFWLLSRALFAEPFRLKPWHGAAWGLLAGAGLVNCYALAPQQPLAEALGGAILVITLGCSLMAVMQSLATWRGDLVEGRRRLRVFIVAAGAAYTLLNTGTKLVLHDRPAAAEWASLVDAVGLALVVLPIAWRLLGSVRAELFELPPAPGVPVPLVPSAVEPARDDGTVAPALDAADLRRVAALQRLMEHDRVYREEGLSIGALAERLGLAEHKLRRLINQQLGWRNFNQYLNAYRLADAKAALADPQRAEVPVLTIAMDAGFQSLGPFNRAFKADTGLTPSEYRRQALAAAPGAAPASAPVEPRAAALSAAR
ncbi:helix-turn-helix domain-containing protein [Aquabacterium sp.]|uniref:AraC family transcriptional regulator n=1 Tax=Aquabacterium sp. TaxID=1872578 RepID=UPI003782DA46